MGGDDRVSGLPFFFFFCLTLFPTRNERRSQKLTLVKTVGAICGYLQGGGHGPASHEFGLGADQVLEYQVVLASGEHVTANACQHKDLFTALRGGGGGTYGIVTSVTVKAFPERPALGHVLDIVPLNARGTAQLLNATANVIARVPALVDEGFSGTAVLLKRNGKWCTRTR